MSTVPLVVPRGTALSLPTAKAIGRLAEAPEGAIVVAPARACRDLGTRFFRSRTVIVLGEDPPMPGEAFLVLPERPTRAMLDRAVAAARRSAEDVDALRAASERLAAERRLRHELLEIGASLSAEPELNRLLENILGSARALVQADAGSLYLLETAEDGESLLRFLLAQNDSCAPPPPQGSLNIDAGSIAGMVAKTGGPLRIDDVRAIPVEAPYSFNPSFDLATGYSTRSVLAVPMTDRRGQLVGVLQLINRKREPGARLSTPEDFDGQVLPFSGRDQELLRALAAQAAVVIENSRLVLEIQHLFEAFVRAAVTAIEQRDPPTSGHSARVAIYATNLARALASDPPGSFAGVSFPPEAIRQLRYAALLHDVGKLGVRERVLTKSAKLYPYQDEVIRERFHHARRALQLAAAGELLEGLASRSNPPDEASLAELETRLLELERDLDGALESVLRANDPTIPVEGLTERLHEIARRRFPGPEGRPIPLLSSRELHLLNLSHGNLDEEERREIESHVVHSTRFLETLPWPRFLERVPEIVAHHHEKLDGSGYPSGLTAPAIPLEARILAIADIYDALTSSDRPYRESLPPDKALKILQEEAAQGALDAGLVALFERSGAWRLSGFQGHREREGW